MSKKHEAANGEPSEEAQGVAFFSKDSEEFDHVFKVPASDQKGHSEKIYFRMPGYILAAVNRVVKSNYFPDYLTSSDFYRHAVVRQLAWLDTQGPTKSASRNIAIMNEILNEAQEDAEYDEMFDRLLARCFQLAAKGRKDDAVGIVKDVVYQVEDMPPGKTQDRYMRRLQAEFGAYLT